MSEEIHIPANEQLSIGRVQQGLTIARVAGELNLPVSVILAIEEARYDELYGDAFICGVMSAYARLLGIDPQSLVDGYKQQSVAHIDVPATIDEAIVDAHLSWRHLLATRIALQHMKYRTAYGILAVIVLAIVVRIYSSNEAIIENPVETSITIDTSVGTTIVSSLDAMPIADPTGDFVPDVVMHAQPSVHLTDAVAGFERTITGNNSQNISSLSFTFVADCWVEVLDGNNDKIFASMQTANKKLVLTGKPPFRITLGYAPGVALSYNSQAVPINADSTNVAKLVLGNT